MPYEMIDVDMMLSNTEKLVLNAFQSKQFRNFIMQVLYETKEGIIEREWQNEIQKHNVELFYRNLDSLLVKNYREAHAGLSACERRELEKEWTDES